MCQFDTMNNSQIGLTNTSNFIYVHANSNFPMGTILIDSTANASFCNTKFENLKKAISLSSPYKFVLDNCEFKHNDICLFVNYQTSTLQQIQITDNIFSHSNYGIYMYDHTFDALIENNIFFDIIFSAIKLSFTGGMNVINNTFINGTYAIDQGFQRSHNTYTFNTFINFTNAFHLDISSTFGTNYVKYNEFINNHIAVVINAKQNQYIQYNNFISN
eukprot:326197_1